MPSKGFRGAGPQRLCLLALIVTAAALYPRESSGAEELTVRFGYQQTIWGAPAMVAVHEKVFADTGIRVEGVMFGTGKDARDALIGGRIDVVSVGGTPFLIGAAKADLVAVAMAAYAGKTLAVVARRGAGITSVSDLRGKSIASKVGTITDYIFHNLVAPDFGLRPEDYRTVNLPFQSHVSALASGSVDAFAGVEPYPSLAVVNGMAVKLVDFGAYDFAPLVLAMRESFVRDRPEAVLAFLKGWKKVVAIFRADAARPVSIMMEVFDGLEYEISPEILTRCLENMEVTTEYRPGLHAYFQEQAENLKKAGKIDDIPDWDRVFTTELKRQAGLP
jgi:NitT/TauT family transport system substrate-binding protein